MAKKLFRVTAEVTYMVETLIEAESEDEAIEESLGRDVSLRGSEHGSWVVIPHTVSEIRDIVAVEK